MAPPPASICFVTRRRREYLAVALASVSGQSRAAGCEVLVIEDDAPDPATRDLAGEHGARYVALGAQRGINAARNVAATEAAGDLVVLLDDDVEVWDGWLTALFETAREHPEADVIGGPIRARIENPSLNFCGREPPAITTLDLGEADRDAEFVWGANLAFRRSALAKAGRFDPALSAIGDEEEWLRRLRAAGGRVHYAARAGVDHRRTGDDATLRALARANWHRGRQARRYDETKGTVPFVSRELRVLAGCAWHAARYRCHNGILLGALAAGRIAEALARQPPPAGPDFLSGASGTLSRADRASAATLDLVANLATLPRRALLRRSARAVEPQHVLVLSVARPEYAGAAAAAGRELERSGHSVDVRLTVPLPGAGKWENLNAALARHPPREHDWLLVVDDDVVLPRAFLDLFLLCCERYGFRLAQPSHAFNSHAAWPVTRRRPQAIARRTRFVEIGPVTALHRETFSELLPFPDLQMGWGLDAHWAAVADSRGWPMGVVDATPIRHTRPVAESYPHAEAIAEAERFLADRPYLPREASQRTLVTYRGWR